MGKLEKLEKLQKLKESGTITEQEFNTEKEKLMNNKSTNSKKNRVIIAIIVLIVLIVGGIFAVYYFNNNNTETNSNNNTTGNEEGFKQTSANVYANGADNVSFASMNSDDENLTDIQREIVGYFDNNYLQFFSETAQKYPQIFKNAKVKTTAAVLKVLESSDDKFEVLAVDCGPEGYNYFMDYNTGKMTDIKDIPVERLLIISGKQMNERLVTGDTFYIYGRYQDVENREIDGTTYMVSLIDTNNIVKVEDSNDKYSFSTIKDIAEYIFGEDIKVNEPVYGQDYEDYEIISGVSRYYGGDGNADFYKVTLDNQSNANFKVFNMYTSQGLIAYNKIHNELSDNIEKNLWISADFQHYIVSTYDSGTQHVYIDYFDKDLNKLWSREFDYTSTKAYVSPMDYTDNQMAVVVDNDLYLIDLETGENVIEPVIVGEKVRVIMTSDKIILIGDNNKDAIMGIDYSGNILFRNDAGSTDIEIINSAAIQTIDGKMIVTIYGTETLYGGPFEKYFILNSDGTIETTTDMLYDTAG